MLSSAVIMKIWDLEVVGLTEVLLIEGYEELKGGELIFSSVLVYLYI